MSEVTQLESVKSMIRYLPPNGTAGFARSCERIERRPPSPPPRITAIVRFTRSMLARASGSGHQRWDPGGLFRAARGAAVAIRAACAHRAGNEPPRARGPPGRSLQEQPRVDEVAVEHHGPMKVRAGRVTRVALVADHVTATHVAAGVDAARVAWLHVGVPGLQPLAVGDDDDPCRIGAVGIVPADVDDRAGARRLDGRAVRRDEVDAGVEVGAVAHGRLPREPGAPEVLGDVA